MGAARSSGGKGRVFASNCLVYRREGRPASRTLVVGASSFVGVRTCKRGVPHYRVGKVYAWLFQRRWRLTTRPGFTRTAPMARRAAEHLYKSASSLLPLFARYTLNHLTVLRPHQQPQHRLSRTA